MARERSAGKKKGSEADEGRDGRGHDQKFDFELELDLDLGRDKHHDHKRNDGLDLEIDVDRHGKWLEIDVDLGDLDFELKVDARQLQPDSTPAAALIGGEGNAVGEETLVDADIFCRLIDFGDVTLAFGTATFKSAARSEGDLVFAAADCFASVSGADLIFAFNEKTSATLSKNGVSFASETSTTSYIAIDFEEFDLATGPIIIETFDVDSYNRCMSKLAALAGNVATLDVDALVNAENTLVDVSSSVLTVENQLSSVSAVVVTAVG